MTHAESVTDAMRELADRPIDAVVASPEFADALLRPRADRADITTPVVVLADPGDDAQAVELVGAGAAGWVHRTASAAVLSAAIRSACQGETQLPSSVLSQVMSTLAAPAESRSRPLERLTPREAQILQMLGQGMSRSEIAVRLRVSPNTVRTHIQSILQRLHVHSVLAAVALLHHATRGYALGGLAEPFAAPQHHPAFPRSIPGAGQVLTQGYPARAGSTAPGGGRG